MIIRCDNCSVSLQLDESKVPAGNFTVRCPRCQNMLRVQKDASGKGSSTVQQLAENKPAPATGDNSQEFAHKESEMQINSALRSLLEALKKDNTPLEASDDELEKPRRILLCLGAKLEQAAKLLSDAGYKVYVAQTPAQANERLREGKVEILMFSQDFAPEHSGAAVIQQRVNAMYSAERRRLYFISLEESGATMNANEAFLRNLNLIVNFADLPQLPLILNRTLTDFNSLYMHFNRASSLAGI